MSKSRRSVVNNLWFDKGSMVALSMRLEVLDAHDVAVAEITSLNGFMKFRRTWAGRKFRTTDVALVVKCEASGSHLLDSSSAFRAFAARQQDGVHDCHVVVSSPLPSDAQHELSDREGADFQCWRRASAVNGQGGRPS